MKPKPAFVSAETAWRMMTKRDPHGNIVRGTIAALAAAVGGADAITVLPYSAALGLPDAHARRIARNTQTILIEESNLYRVADPAAGSGAIETLTDALCAKAWTLFQEIEREGGVGRSAGERLDPICRRENSRRAREECRQAQGHVDRHQRLSLSRRGQGLGLGRASPACRRVSVERAAPHPPRRELRALARPKRCLSRQDWRAAESLSRHAWPRRRFQRARKLRQELLRGRRHRGRRSRAATNLAEQFKKSGAKLACLCSSDKVYAKEAEAAASALAKAGAKHLYLAGKPGENKQALEAAGLGTFLHQGCDSLDILNHAYDRM